MDAAAIERELRERRIRQRLKEIGESLVEASSDRILSKVHIGDIFLELAKTYGRLMENRDDA